MAAQKPSTSANKAQRNGHGKAVRTDMRGALTVRRRRIKRSRIDSPVYQPERKQPPESAFRRLSLCSNLLTNSGSN
jgi:hypothetical protein